MTKTMTANVPVAMRDPNATCNRFVGDHERCGRPGIVAYNVEGARGQQEVRCAEHGPDPAGERADYADKMTDRLTEQKRCSACGGVTITTVEGNDGMHFTCRDEERNG